MRVPRRYVLVWIGRSFPHYCRLAVESIVRADPRAEIDVFVGGALPAGPEFDAIRLLPSVSIHRIDPGPLFDPLSRGDELRELFEAIPDSAPSARSNLLRYALLWERGGVYVDFDVLVRRPLTTLANGAFVGAERVWKHDTARVEGRWKVRMLPATVAWALAWTAVLVDCRLTGGRLGASRRLEPSAHRWSAIQPNNAIIGTPPQSAFLAGLLDGALDADPAVRFALGPTLVTKVAGQQPATVTVLPPEVLYPIPPGESIRFFADRTAALPAANAAVHYVASNHRRLLDRLGPDDRRFGTHPAPFWWLAPSASPPPIAVTDERVDEPLVSCLMVTRNRVDLARRAVECFARQSHPARELVIVDDGDDDYGPMLEPFIAAGHRIEYVRVVSRADRRLGALRNAAIDAADGEWCIQWDDDEWYHPQRIEDQLRVATDTSCDAVALRWTLMSVQSARYGALAFRADTGLATPGTILHRRDLGRYPNLSKGEDSVFLRSVHRTGHLEVMGTEASHLFVRCFHGANTWDERHFLARLRRRAVDWPSYASARYHGDLRRHRAFRLNPQEQAAISALTAAVPVR